MKSGWKTVSLESLGQVINGGTPNTKTSEYWDGTNLWITPAEMGMRQTPYLAESRRKLTDAGLKNSSASLVPSYSVILSTRAPIGHLVINTRPMAFNQGCRAIVPNKDTHYKYLFYFLLGSVGLLNDLGAGTTFKELSAKRLKSVHVPLPSLDEQKRIVAILDEAFAGIETAIVNTENNLANSRELFECYLQTVFSKGREGWVERKLDDVCSKITDGKHGDCENEQGSGYYFLSAKDIKRETLNYEYARQITKTDFEETHRRTNLEPGDILVTNAGTIGRTAIAPDDPKTYKTTFQKSVAILKPIPDVIDSRFCLFGLKARLAELMNLSSGTAQKNLLLRDTRAFRLSMPLNIVDQRKVAYSVYHLQCEVQHLEEINLRKLRLFADLKQSLLQKAFSGELTADADAVVDEIQEAATA